MSHFTTMKSAYTSREALRTALTRCGVPASAIAVSTNGPMVMTGYGGRKDRNAHVIVMGNAQGNTEPRYGATDRIVRLCSDVGFVVGEKSEVIYDDYHWPSEELRGSEPTAISWLKRVRMEYDAEMMKAKAAALGKPFQRIEKNGRIYAAIGV